MGAQQGFPNRAAFLFAEGVSPGTRTPGLPHERFPAIIRELLPRGGFYFRKLLLHGALKPTKQASRAAMKKDLPGGIGTGKKNPKLSVKICGRRPGNIYISGLNYEQCAKEASEFVVLEASRNSAG